MPYLTYRKQIMHVLGSPTFPTFLFLAFLSHQVPHALSLSTPSRVLCVGETLWDGLPLGLFLGGAPTNVAIHLSELGVPVSVAARVGPDRLGSEATRRLKVRGVGTSLVQRHPFIHKNEAVSTGLVVAEIDEKTRDASYVFDTPAAWDYLEFTPELEKAACNADVVVVGTIASRLGSEEGALSAQTIREVCRVAGGRVVLDVNLRPPWYTPHSILDFADYLSAQGSFEMLKVNDDELELFESWCDLSPIEDGKQKDITDDDEVGERAGLLGKALGAKRVCITRGDKGAVLWSSTSDGEQVTANSGFAAPEELGNGQVTTDTVGAGDSFLASLIKSLLLEGEDDATALSRSCALGGYVARCQGAVPPHADAPKELKEVFGY